jgi:D-alanine-D-alanine ligase
MRMPPSYRRAIFGDTGRTIRKIMLDESSNIRNTVAQSLRLIFAVRHTPTGRRVVDPSDPATERLRPSARSLQPRRTSRSGTAARSSRPLRTSERTTAPMLVWVLVPQVESDDPAIQCYYDFTQGEGEFQRAFAALDIAYRWQPVTMDNFRPVLEGIRHASGDSSPVVFNLCDGDEVNGAPGLSVIRHLDELGLPYTGADEHFYDVTTSKITMKSAFEAACVPTAPWEVIPAGAKRVNGLFARIPGPLILKPAVSAGSLGIGCRNVVHTPRELHTQLSALREGVHGWSLAEGGLFVERFIEGPEFTTFIVGNARAYDSATIYAPVERVFNRNLPPEERFLSFDRLWELYEREAPVAAGEDFWQYAPVEQAFAERVKEVSWAAYEAVGGTGYGRVDLRMDSRTGDLFVLEVNAQCGLSEDENVTSIGAIIRVSETSYGAVVQAILAEAVRHAREAVRLAS